MHNAIALSVIIPTKNRFSLLRETLKSLTRQTCPTELFEVLVIDNGSTDSTRDVVDAFSGDFPHIHYFHEDSPGLHVGRNRGLKEAKGDIIVYADDDIEAFPEWLEGVEEAFRNTDVMLVGGKNLPKFEVDPPGWILERWMKHHPEGRVLGHLSILDFGDAIKEINPKYVFGCNFSIRKAVLHETGGFHPDAMPRDLIKYRGDGETYVSEYILKKKLKALYYPKASVYHHVPKERMTFDYFCYRSYIQGISDSYTQIRSMHHQKNSTFEKGRLKNIPKKNGLSPKNVARLFNRGINRVRTEFVRQTNHHRQDSADRFRRNLQKSYKDGFNYHQQEAMKDEKLVEWILRKDYSGENARLPL